MSEVMVMREKWGGISGEYIALLRSTRIERRAYGIHPTRESAVVVICVYAS